MEWNERDPQWVHFHLSSGRRVRKRKEKEERWERNGWRRGEEAKRRCEPIIPPLPGKSSPWTGQ